LGVIALTPMADSAVSRQFALGEVGEPLVQNLSRRAAQAAREAGCAWLHVDFEEQLDAAYLSCGFTPAKAGFDSARALDRPFPE
jgi:hypothetical protein